MQFPSLDRDRLSLSCLELARSIVWHKSPVDDVLAKSFAAILLNEAVRHEEFLIGQGRNPNIITFAVSYLAHTHAIPPLGTDLGWFRDGLAVLIELCSPNCRGRSADERLYKEIEHGLMIARGDYEK